MSLGHATWKGRRKGTLRRLGRDLRTFGPLLAVAACFLTSAGAIVAAERVVPASVARPTPTPTAAARAAVSTAGTTAYWLTTSSSSTSKVSAAPPGMSP